MRAQKQQQPHQQNKRDESSGIGGLTTLTKPSTFLLARQRMLNRAPPVPRSTSLAQRAIAPGARLHACPRADCGRHPEYRAAGQCPPQAVRAVSRNAGEDRRLHPVAVPLSNTSLFSWSASGSVSAARIRTWDDAPGSVGQDGAGRRTIGTQEKRQSLEIAASSSAIGERGLSARLLHRDFRAPPLRAGRWLLRERCDQAEQACASRSSLHPLDAWESGSVSASERSIIFVGATC